MLRPTAALVKVQITYNRFFFGGRRILLKVDLWGKNSDVQVNYDPNGERIFTLFTFLFTSCQNPKVCSKKNWSGIRNLSKDIWTHFMLPGQYFHELWTIFPAACEIFLWIIDNISSCLENISDNNGQYFQLPGQLECRWSSGPDSQRSQVFPNILQMQSCKYKFSGQSEGGGYLGPDIPNTPICHLPHSCASAETTMNLE